MIRDIDKILPEFPGMKWAALFNWNLSVAEINELVRHPIFPEDSKWHSVMRDNYNKDNSDIIVDGHVIKKVSNKRLT